MNDHVVFFREFLNKFEETGSAVPSSRWAAMAMTNPLRKTNKTQSILEVGPGTGSVTQSIIKDMVDGDRLTVCEINPRFMARLRRKLSSNKDFIKHSQCIDFFEGPVQNMPEETKFDLIVCALPFTNMKVSIIADIFSKLERLSNENTHITFFEYIGLRTIGRITSVKERRDRLEQIDQFFVELNNKYDRETERVWFNFTPINVHTLKAKLAA